MAKFIKGDAKLLNELQVNLFSRISETGHEINGNEEDGYALKVDMEMFNDAQIRLIETAMKARISAGVLPEGLWEVNEELVQNSFCLTADSDEKLEIIQNDILRGAKVPEENVVILQQPWAPEMYSTLVYVVLAFGLTEDQMKAVQLSAKTAKTGIKITNFTKKATMVATATGNVVNRVSREVLLAGTEIGVTVGAGAVKTGVEMAACAANIAVRDLNPKQLASGPNVQAFAKTMKGLFKKGKESDKITNGFAMI